MSQFSTDFSKMKYASGELEKISGELSAIDNELQEVMTRIKRDSSVGKYMQNADSAVNAMEEVCKKSRRFSEAFSKIISLYEGTENKILNESVAVGEGGTLASGASGMASNSPVRTYEGWGLTGGSVRPVEYAYFSDFCNTASRENSTEAMVKKFRELLKEKMPEGHPVRDAKIYAYKEGTNHDLDAILIEIDSDHAIMVFAGTESLGDGFTDVGVVADTVPGVQVVSAANHVANPVEWFSENQFEAANRIVKSLPYKDVKVTGHSLGGHIAADVTLNNKNVSWCFTFDAPGRGDAVIKNTFDQERVNRIFNYCAKGSNVNKVGMQIGSTEYLNVEPNKAGIFTNHSIDKIAEALGGRDELFAPDEE